MPFKTLESAVYRVEAIAINIEVNRTAIAANYALLARPAAVALNELCPQNRREILRT